MTSNSAKLGRRIQLELDDIEQVVTRAQAAWQEYQTSGNAFYLDSVALSLHNFYNGVERILEEIATGLDRHLPTGSRWHKELLNQMTAAIPEIRPSVISSSTMSALDEYCRFRHLVRNIYSFCLEPDKIEPLVEGVAELFAQVQQELTDFARWLSSL